MEVEKTNTFCVYFEGDDGKLRKGSLKGVQPFTFLERHTIRSIIKQVLRFGMCVGVCERVLAS